MIRDAASVTPEQFLIETQALFQTDNQVSQFEIHPSSQDMQADLVQAFDAFKESLHVYLVRSGMNGIDARRQLLKVTRKFMKLDEDQREAYKIVLSSKRSHIVNV